MKAPDAAGIMLIRSDPATGEDQILLVRRADNRSDPDAGCWASPGGGAKRGETPWETAKREFAEEVGGLPRGLKCLWISDWQRPEDDFVFRVYTCRTDDMEWEPDLDEAETGYENTAVGWYSLGEMLAGEAYPGRDVLHPKPLLDGFADIFRGKTVIHHVSSQRELMKSAMTKAAQQIDGVRPSYDLEEYVMTPLGQPPDTVTTSWDGTINLQVTPDMERRLQKIEDAVAEAEDALIDRIPDPDLQSAFRALERVEDTLEDAEASLQKL